MIGFAEAFPDREIVSAWVDNWAGLTSCPHYLKDPLKREFYAEMCRVERWSTRTLEKKIGGMLFERTALSRKPDQLARRNWPPSGTRTASRPTWSFATRISSAQEPASGPAQAGRRPCQHKYVHDWIDTFSKGRAPGGGDLAVGGGPHAGDSDPTIDDNKNIILLSISSLPVS